MESAMRTGCLGLLVLSLTGALSVDARAQSGSPERLAPPVGPSKPVAGGTSPVQSGTSPLKGGTGDLACPGACPSWPGGTAPIMPGADVPGGSGGGQSSSGQSGQGEGPPHCKYKAQQQ